MVIGPSLKGMGVAVIVGVCVGVEVFVGVGVFDGVRDRVGVRVAVTVNVGLSVMVGVGLVKKVFTEGFIHNQAANTNRPVMRFSPQKPATKRRSFLEDAAGIPSLIPV
jgi:hypothetical protein